MLSVGVFCFNPSWFVYLLYIKNIDLDLVMGTVSLLLYLTFFIVLIDYLYWENTIFI
jgi:hypothetical protein